MQLRVHSTFHERHGRFLDALFCSQRINVLIGILMLLGNQLWSTRHQEVLKDRVRELGGSFDVNLTLATTHLLAASTDTEKYTVATSMKVNESLPINYRQLHLISQQLHFRQPTVSVR